MPKPNFDNLQSQPHFAHLPNPRRRLPATRRGNLSQAELRRLVADMID